MFMSFYTISILFLFTIISFSQYNDNLWWPLSGIENVGLDYLSHLRNDVFEDIGYSFIWSTGHTGTHTIGFNVFGTHSNYNMTDVVGVNEYLFISKLIPDSLQRASLHADGEELIRSYCRYKLYAILNLIRLGKDVKHYFQAGLDVQFGESYIYQAVIPDKVSYIRLRRNRYELYSTYSMYTMHDKRFRCLNKDKAQVNFSNLFCPIYNAAIIKPKLPYDPKIDAHISYLSYWYIDENERQWRMFRAHNPKMQALEIFWEKSSGNVINKSVIEAIIEFAQIPRVKGDRYNVEDDNQHRGSKKRVDEFDDSLHEFQKIDKDYRLYTYGNDNQNLDYNNLEDENWWINLGIKNRFPEHFTPKITDYNSTLKTGYNFFNNVNNFNADQSFEFLSKLFNKVKTHQISNQKDAQVDFEVYEDYRFKNKILKYIPKESYLNNTNNNYLGPYPSGYEYNRDNIHPQLRKPLK